MNCRVLVLALLALPLSGCDLPFGKDQASWALINKSKIQSAISDSVKQNNPYPAEIGNDFAARQEENQRLNQQISDLKSTAMQRCMSQANNDAGRPGSKPAGHPALAGAAIATLSRDQVPAYAQARQGLDISECLRDIEKDQLILDLKEKAKGFSQLQQQRRAHDIEVQKIMTSTIDTAVAEYARSHKFALIISNEQSIAYSESKQVLDVTDGVIEQIRNSSSAR